MFSAEIADQLKYYVYRLIDPRTGETFYLGKGKGNRVFTHAAGDLTGDIEEHSDKLKRIREINLSGLKVQHVIHRHGLDSKTAFEVEAALLDAYPGTTNISSGQGSSERGALHAKEIIELYGAEEADFRHPMLAITINRSATEGSIYSAVRYAWKLSKARVVTAEYVLAVLNGLIVGVFVPHEWLDANPENFPGTYETRKGRMGFNGEEASLEIQKLYLRKRMPDQYRKRGAANPVKYIKLSSERAG